jgi:hypothetical protein
VVSFVKAYSNAATFEASNASELVLVRQPQSAKSFVLTGNQKIRGVEALQDTGR